LKVLTTIRHAINVIKILGLREAIQTMFKAKVLRDEEAFTKMMFAICDAKVINHEHIMYRGRLFYVPREFSKDFLTVLHELHRGFYRFSEKHDVVADVGGFLGETAWWFLVEGLARRVVVYEPVYYEVCKRNLSDVAEVYPYAIYKERGRIRLIVEGGRSRTPTKEIDSSGGFVEVNAVTFEDVLSGVSGDVAVKVDCEGCEQYLAEVPCQVLRRAREYIVEVHPWIGGARQMLLKHFKECGFRAEVKAVLDPDQGIEIYHFVLES